MKPPVAILLLFLTVVLSDDLYAQPLFSGNAEHTGIGVPPYRALPKHHFRLSGGGGATPLFQGGATSSALVGSYQYEHFAISVAGIQNISHGRTPNETFQEADALIGYAWDGIDLGMTEMDGVKFYLQASLGVGYWNYSSRYRFRRQITRADSAFLNKPSSFINGIGFPVQVQMTYSVYEHIAIGPILFVNFNPKLTNYGAALMLEISYP